jgi:membrane protease YdiL (CAAX protease family)
MAPAAVLVGGASGVLLVVTLLALWVFFDRARRRAGQSLDDLGYRFSWLSGSLGAACGAALVGLVLLTAHIDGRLFGLVPHLEQMRSIAEAGVWGVLPFLLGNAILAPVVEEFVWRGHIQSRLAAASGQAGGLVVTAVLFAAKHMIVDLSVERTTSLIVVAVALGLVRLRLGTFASTVAHFGLNLTASTIAVVLAFR